MKLYPLIMAGGSGTRFWPLSRQSRPKQFLALTSSRSLIAETAERLRTVAKADDTLVVCGSRHVRAVRTLTRLPVKNIIAEPVARNTAPAIALGLAHILRRDPSGILAALPADHHIGNPKAFGDALRLAARVAEAGQIVTIGLRPTRPDTGFGYIHAGEPIEGDPHVRKALAFVEKPDAATAEGYLASGKYLWNGGIFVFRADVMKVAFERHAPEIANGIDQLAAAVGGRKYASTLKRAFTRFPSISIDYAIAEKVDNMVVISGDFGWSDVGSFAAIPEIRPRDEGGNVKNGQAILIDSTNCVVLAGARPVAVVGMKGAVVVDAGDAILVVDRNRVQDVRKVVDFLRSHKLNRYL